MAASSRKSLSERNSQNQSVSDPSGSLRGPEAVELAKISGIPEDDADAEIEDIERLPFSEVVGLVQPILKMLQVSFLIDFDAHCNFSATKKRSLCSKFVVVLRKSQFRYERFSTVSAQQC